MGYNESARSYSKVFVSSAIYLSKGLRTEVAYSAAASSPLSP